MSEENSRAVVELFVKVNIDEFTVFELVYTFIFTWFTFEIFVHVLWTYSVVSLRNNNSSGF